MNNKTTGGAADDPLFIRVRGVIDGAGLLPPGGGLVAGVSGGADSLCLLHILLKYFGEGASRRLIAVHVNHMLRGGESSRDEAHVESFCAAYGVRFTGVSEDVPSYAKACNISVEAAARGLRYRALERVRREAEAASGLPWRIAVAHNRDDLAETVLMNILRGAGAGGLRGMKAGTPFVPRDARGILPDANIDTQSGTPPHFTSYVIRPLIGVGRAQIEEYLERNGITPVFDSSNADISYTRNRLRAGLIPLLKKEYNPRVTDALCGLSESAELDGDYLEGEALKAYASCRMEQAAGAGGATLSIRRFNGLHRALAARVIRLACAAAYSAYSITSDGAPGASRPTNCHSCGAPGASRPTGIPHAPGASRPAEAPIRSIGRAHITDVLRLAYSGRTGAILHLPGGLRVSRSYDELTFVSTIASEKTGVKTGEKTGACGAGPDVNTSVNPAKPLDPPGFVTKSLHKKEIEIVEQINNIGYNSYEQMFDADVLRPDDCTLRFRRKGDAFYPINAPGSKKLKDFLIDIKIPAALRDSVCLLARGSEIAWVIGYRVSEQFKVKENTQNILRVRYFP